MNCLRCQKSMKEVEVNGAEVDVCSEGCGALWFDAHELPRIDEEHEVPMEFRNLLENLPDNEGQSLEEKLNCPRCDSQPMFRHFWSVERRISIDDCPRCAGVWLDCGELTQIHKLFSTEEERKQAAHKLFDDVFANELQNQSMKNHDKLTHTLKVLRYVTPSALTKKLMDILN